MVRAGPSSVGAVLLVAGVLLAGCGDDPPAAEEGSGVSAETGLLHGVVVDQAIRPLAGVDVTAQLAGGGPLEATTGDDGLFRFAGVPPGSYALRAEKASYLSAHALANVAAGEEEPPAVQLQLVLQVGDLPFFLGLKWEGIVGCATMNLNLCSAPNQGAGIDPIGDRSAIFFWDEFVPLQRIPEAVQVEAVWEPTLPTSERMKPYVGWTTPEAWAVFLYGGTFDTSTHTSPSFYRVSQEEAAEAELGTECGLIVEFIGAGEYDDPASDPPGLVVNQPVDLFVHFFYGYTPAEEWRFVTDGAPPLPPA